MRFLDINQFETKIREILEKNLSKKKILNIQRKSKISWF
jgi:hypothetical protein